MYESHDAQSGGHRGREKTFLTVSRDFYWLRQYQFVRNYIRTCEVCQRVNPRSSSRAPLQTLPVPEDCWQSVSINFVFGFFEDNHSQRLCSILYRNDFRLHGLPRELVSGRDPPFTADFWQSLFRSLETRLKMSSSYYPETNGLT